MEAQKLGGSDMLILAASWISLMASGELPIFLFFKKMIIEHNSESITLGWSWGLLGAILKPFREVLGSPGAVWEALGVVLGALGAVLVSPSPTAGLGPNWPLAVLTTPFHHKTHLNFTQLNTPQLNSSHLTF